MVDPVLLVAVPIGVAFLLPLFDKAGRWLTLTVQGLTLLALFGLTGWWSWQLAGGAEPILATTGGWDPPLGISLRLGLPEAVLTLVAQISALGGILFLHRRDEHGDVRGLLLQMVLLAGATGLVLTRDLFNVFVFLEIVGIATYALAALGREDDSLEAGFKYMMLGAVASAFLLGGIGLLYKHTGTLNIDRMLELMPLIPTSVELSAALGVVFLVLLVGFAAELKLLPLNGPGVDLYDGVEPGVTALYVGTAVNGVAFAFYKVYGLFPEGWDTVVVALGAITFVGANLSALRQTRVRRMLGWSSTSQMGLVVALIPFVHSGDVPLLAVGLLLVNHSLAKGALLGLTGLHESKALEGWRGAFSASSLRRLALFGALLSLVGLPPFPGFFGKWQALVGLSSSGGMALVAILLVGSLAELAWGFRFARILLEEPVEGHTPGVTMPELFGSASQVALLAGFGLYLSWIFVPGIPLSVILLGTTALVLLFVKDLPPRLLAGVSFVAVLAALGASWPQLSSAGPLEVLFSLLILGGALVTTLAWLGLPERNGSHYGIFLGLAGSLLLVVGSDSLLGFFVGWEVMTWTSALAIGQGKRGARPSWIYLVFAAAGGFLVMGGFMVAHAQGATAFSELAALSPYATSLFWGLVVTGILVKLGSFGVHIWAPEAYSESPDVFTAFLSGVVSKAPIFALALVLAKVGAPAIPRLQQIVEGVDWTWPVAWLALLTAFGMTLLALFQEDAKRLLAYSSVGQVAYIVMALAVMSPLGWEAGLYHAVHHTLFKAMLFLAIAGVVHRTGTRFMYQMGGLIHRMPFSYFVVMIGIIALSGVPPLGGFLGKWMLYEALVERGWLLLAGFAMFSSLLAFPYLFRLIHSIFLGQLKPEHREVREAPWPLILAQFVLMGGIMVLAMWPQALLRPLDTLVVGVFGESGVAFEGLGVSTAYGHYEPVWMMVVVGGIFAVAFAIQLVVVPRAPKVGQLDIGYSAELPPPPEDTHFAWDFFRPVFRAYEPILSDRVTRFWSGFVDTVEALTDAGRALWTGNGQTYVLYLVALAVGLAVFGLVP